MYELVQFRPIIEVAAPLISLAPLGLGLVGLAYTDKQKKYFKKRDGGVCQLEKVIDHNCTASKKTPEDDREIDIHHIVPQRYAEAVGIKNADTPLNGVSVCKNIHRGRDKNAIHPDIAGTHSQDDFAKVFEERQKKLKDKKPYWNTAFDRILHVIAMRNTEKAEENGLEFPKKKKKKPF